MCNKETLWIADRPQGSAEDGRAPGRSAVPPAPQINKRHTVRHAPRIRSLEDKKAERIITAASPPTLAGSYLSAATRSPARRVGAAPSGLRLLPGRRKGEAETAARREGAIGVGTREGKGVWKLPEGQMLDSCVAARAFPYLLLAVAQGVKDGFVLDGPIIFWGALISKWAEIVRRWRRGFSIDIVSFRPDYNWCWLARTMGLPDVMSNCP